MSDYILDTNAFIYLIDTELGNKPPITIDKKHIDCQKFHDLCVEANCLYITSQTLYELLWQSVEKNDIKIFEKQCNQMVRMRKKYGMGFSILNDEAVDFDIANLAKEFEEGIFDIEKWINQKRNYEKRKISFLIFSVYSTVIMLIAEEYQLDIDDWFCEMIKSHIEVRLDDFSKKYYDINTFKNYKNSSYDKCIDDILLEIIEITIKIIEEALNGKENNFVIPSGEYSSGIEYIFKLMHLNKRHDSKWFDKYDKQIVDLIFAMEQERGLNDSSTLFIKRLCNRVVKEKTKLRKNDGIDYGIVSCLDNHIIINETHRDFNPDDIYLISFDMNVYHFSKEEKVLYDQGLYDKLLVEDID